MLCSLGLTNLNVYRISPKIIGKDIVFLSWQSLYLPVFDANNLHRAETNENSGTNIILIAKPRENSSRTVISYHSVFCKGCKIMYDGHNSIPGLHLAVLPASISFYCSQKARPKPVRAGSYVLGIKFYP